LLSIFLSTFDFNTALDLNDVQSCHIEQNYFNGSLKIKN